MTQDEKSEKLEKIRQYILKSGYPTEIEIGNILRKNGWIVGNQWPYVDKNEKKTRAIDVFAMKLLSPQCGVLMIVECKKSIKNDWVFYTQQKRGELLPALGIVVDFIKKINKPPISDKIARLYANQVLGGLFGWKTSGQTLLDRLSEVHFLNEAIKIGVCNVVPSGKDDFFEATQQLISALQSIGETAKPFFVYPVAVFNGEMYEFFQQENEINIMPVNHVQFISFGTEVSPCIIDVVRSTYFLQFLQMIDNDIKILSDIVNYQGDSK